MNIFYLDHNPALCAQYHTDKHVVKMILESAQMLCTALNTTLDGQVTPYRSTHVNHPCSIWVRENFHNWLWLYHLMLELEQEWQYRWEHSKRHKSVEAVQSIQVDGYRVEDIAYHFLPEGNHTYPPLAMPEHCKLVDVILSYREYYRTEKQDLHKWTKRDQPSWL